MRSGLRFGHDRLGGGRGPRLFGRIANILVPPVCLACRHPVGTQDTLCAACWRDIAFIRPPLCDRLGIPLPFDTGGPMISAAAAADPPHYDRARVVASFAGIMQSLIHGFKYADRHDARDLFGRWLVSAGDEILTDADLIVPVPMHRWRLFTRRFNQSAILAREVAHRTGHRYEPQLLLRSRATPPQVGLTRRERAANVAGAFRVPEQKRARLDGKAVVLVDDVVTTGSTVDACARVLKAAGAGRVDVLALARVTGDDQINP
jgi:ComF family protein